MAALKQDEETGEVIPRFNCETGEAEYIISSQLEKRKLFKIPTSDLVKETSKGFKIPSSYYTSPKKEIRKERKRLDCSPAATTAILFLLPTTILFYPILGFLTVTIEVIIHIWAHKKNRMLKNQNVYYQSPLHIICQEFCGACKEANSKMKITKLHERRADKIKQYSLEYVRRVVT